MLQWEFSRHQAGTVNLERTSDLVRRISAIACGDESPLPICSKTNPSV